MHPPESWSFGDNSANPFRKSTVLGNPSVGEIALVATREFDANTNNEEGKACARQSEAAPAAGVRSSRAIYHKTMGPAFDKRANLRGETEKLLLDFIKIQLESCGIFSSLAATEYEIGDREAAEHCRRVSEKGLRPRNAVCAQSDVRRNKTKIRDDAERTAGKAGQSTRADPQIARRRLVMRLVLPRTRQNGFSRFAIPSRCLIRHDPCARSFCLPGVIQAQRDQIGDIGFAHTHDRVSAAPVDFDGSVGLRDGAAGEHDVVDIARDFPGIFWL